MQHGLNPNRLDRSAPPHLVILAAPIIAILVAACGGGSHNPATTTVAGSSKPASLTAAAGAGRAPRRSASGARSTTSAEVPNTARRRAQQGATHPSSTGPAAPRSGLLAFAVCMRASGVPNFPDPASGGGTFQLPAGANPRSPAFRAAQAKCQKLMGGGGPPVPGATTHPSAQTMGELRRIAVCMRRHGVPQFPDPRTTVPANRSGFQEITDFDGAILLFPATLNLQAPAYREALTACGAPPLGLRH